MNKIDNIKKLIDSLNSISNQHNSIFSGITNTEPLQNKINQYNDSVFEEYFYTVIVNLTENRETLANEFYERRKEYYNNNYLISETKKEELLKDEISEKYRNDNSHYRFSKRFTEYSGVINYSDIKDIAKEVVRISGIRSLWSAGKNLSKTANFEHQTKESIIIETLFETLKNVKQKALDKNLTISQIALKLVYEEKKINKKEAKNLAQDYGYTSGDKLYQKFCFYSSRANRKGKPSPYTKRKLLNKINLISSVIDLLPDPYKITAKDELIILETFLSNDF